MVTEEGCVLGVPVPAPSKEEPADGLKGECFCGKPRSVCRHRLPFQAKAHPGLVDLGLDEEDEP